MHYLAQGLERLVRAADDLRIFTLIVLSSLSILTAVGYLAAEYITRPETEMNPDGPDTVEYQPVERYSLKLYTKDDISRCAAVLYPSISLEEAEAKYEKINLALGHQTDPSDGELIVLASTGPYVLIAPPV